MITVKNKDTGKEYHIDVTNKTTSLQIKQKLAKLNKNLKVEWQILFDKKDLRINAKTIKDTVESMELFPDSTILLQLNIPKSELTRMKEGYKKFKESWDKSLRHHFRRNEEGYYDYEDPEGFYDYILAIEAISAVGNIDDKDERGETILQYAIQHNINRMIYIALKEGANPNQIFSDGRTPLITAIAGAHSTLFEILIKFGANVHQKGRFDKQTLSPLQIAKNYLQIANDYFTIRGKLYIPTAPNYMTLYNLKIHNKGPLTDTQSFKDSSEYQYYLDNTTPMPGGYKYILIKLEEELEKEKRS